jgi:hypothetical protein
MKKGDSPIIGIGLVFTAFAIWYIWRMSFVVFGKRFFVLFDDMMISMKYAKNIVLGNGLTWNPGERIEGITNLGWTLVMTIPHLFRLPPYYASLFIQLLSVPLLLGTAFYASRIAIEHKINPIAVFFLTTFYYSLWLWGLFGCETTALALLITAAVYYRRRSWLATILLCIGVLVRMDFALLALVFAVINKDVRPAAWVGVVLCGLTTFRLWYYGDILPNTYYLKMTGFPVLPRIREGFYSFVSFLWRFNLLVFLGGLLSLKKLWKIWLLVGAQILYSIWVGGDAWEDNIGGANRYLVIVTPLLFIAIVSGLERIINKSYLLWATGLALFFINCALGPITWADICGFKEPTFRVKNQKMIERTAFDAQITKPGDTIAVAWAGFCPYFLPDRHYLDLLGKNDPYVAHQSSQIIRWKPGHTKWDYDYTFTNARFLQSQGIEMENDSAFQKWSPRLMQICKKDDPSIWIIRVKPI